MSPVNPAPLSRTTRVFTHSAVGSLFHKIYDKSVDPKLDFWSAGGGGGQDIARNCEENYDEHFIKLPLLNNTPITVLWDFAYVLYKSVNNNEQHVLLEEKKNIKLDITVNPPLDGESKNKALTWAMIFACAAYSRDQSSYVSDEQYEEAIKKAI